MADLKEFAHDNRKYAYTSFPEDKFRMRDEEISPEGSIPEQEEQKLADESDYFDAN